ncbi:MAG TPA: hypothetical protein VF802_04935 [Candidatus Limnocylindrales bacterium]
MTAANHRSIAARLARVHLRTGSLSLARTELESLAGRDALDDEALLDLAEVRWRTGDLAGGGEAARAYLETGNEAVVALVVAAEAAVALGRPGEARRLAQRAIAHSAEPIDAVFAGSPRSGVWPLEPSDRGEQGPLFAPAPHLGVAPSIAPVIAPAPEPTLPARAAATDAGGGLWGDLSSPSGLPVSLPAPRDALDAGRAALADGDLAAAAVHLAIAIRLEPGLAAAVLGLVSSAPGAAMDVLRGDALRLAGHEERARRAWAAAIRATEPAAEPAAEPLAEPAAEPLAEPAIEPMTEPGSPDRTSASADDPTAADQAARHKETS